MISKAYLRRQREYYRSKGSEPTPGVIPKWLIGRYLPANPVILEAGAHDGTDTVEMSQLWPDATIHAFEPIPDLYARMKEKTQNIDRIFTYEMGLGSKRQKSKIYVSSGSSDASSSLLKPKQHLKINPHVKFEKTITIQVDTIDGWAKSNNISKLDFMWLDLQGMELPVLQHAKSILQTTKLILAEVSLIETYEGVAQVDELKTFMSEAGFKIIIEDMPYPDMGDILFLRR